MAELREDKKREILEFLEENSEEGSSLAALEVKQIVERFSNENFNTDLVEDLIEELEDEELIERKTAKLDLVYPNKHKDSIESRFEHLLESSSIFNTYFVGVLILLFLFDNKGPAFQYVFGDAVGSPSIIAVRGILFGAIGSYFIGKIVLRGFSLAQEKLTTLQNHKQEITPILLICLIVSSIVFAFTEYTSRSLTTSHLIQIISISVLGGVAVGKYLMNSG